MFFQPNSRTRIGANISLIDGDMFFSNLQTLTISVNLQGVMGKGLASRTKYQFPDVYVAYQDVCRAKQITATKPYLYKRESSLDEELADLGTPLVTPNAVKWFLLFATKRHWKDNSRLDDIEGGLAWVRDNFREQGIQSLAMPALGCGLGGLDWKEVGPLMCQYLHGINISVGNLSAARTSNRDTIQNRITSPLTLAQTNPNLGTSALGRINYLASWVILGCTKNGRYDIVLVFITVF